MAKVRLIATLIGGAVLAGCVGDGEKDDTGTTGTIESGDGDSGGMDSGTGSDSGEDSGNQDSGGGDSGDQDSGDSDSTVDSDTDTAPPQPPPGVLVLAGGGSEGEQDDPSAWSWRAYGALLEGGDVTGDGLIKVAVLSATEETEWIPEYFQILGADSAENMNLGSRADADAVGTCARIRNADAVFIKGGDQGEYYDLWHGTCTEDAIRELHAGGGGVGGTSAGAMSQSQYALAGGMDYVSLDVLADSHTGYLDDLDGGSGIHADFLNLLPLTTVDTHFSQRLRLGRLAGTMARVTDDLAPPVLVGIGLEEETAIVVRYEPAGADGGAGGAGYVPVATVVGRGSVTFLQPGTDAPVRDPGEPLQWYGMQLDRLTDGWRFLLPYTAADGSARAGEVDTAAPPAGAEPVTAVPSSPTGSGGWYADGDLPAHEERFSLALSMYPDDFDAHPGTDTPTLADSAAVLDAWGDRRAAAEDTLCYALYLYPGTVGFLVGPGTSLATYDPAGTDAMDAVYAVTNPATADPPAAAIILDSSAVTWRSLSPEPSVSATEGGSLRAAGLVGLRLSILYSGEDTRSGGMAWSMADREIR